MQVGPCLTYVFVAIWTGFVLRGFLTGRMIMRGGDVVRTERPGTFALVMVLNVVALCFVLLAIAISAR